MTEKQKMLVDSICKKFDLSYPKDDKKTIKEFLDKYSGCRIDYEKANDMFDIMDVIDILGIETKKNGRYMQILCPFHNDKHFGSCIVKDNRFYCFACNTGGNAIKLASGVLDKGYTDTIIYLAKMFGINIDNLLNFDTKIETEKNRLFLTSEEKKLLTLNPRKKFRAYKNLSFTKDGKCEKIEHDDLPMYLIYDSSNINLSTLYNEDKESYKYLVLSKANEIKENYEKTKAMCDIRNNMSQIVIDVFCPKDVIPSNFLILLGKECDRAIKEIESIIEKTKKIA